MTASSELKTMDNLRQKTLSGLFWSLFAGVGNQVVAFLPTILLARLLTLAEFGLIGMLAVFIAIAGTFLDSGFSVALIQKKDATYVDECSMFYFNLLVGALLTLALFLAAPLIAAFYNQPILTGLTRVLALCILIKAFDLIQTTRLTRNLDFKTQFKATLLGTGVAGVIGVVAAYLGAGVWSLAIQAVANDIFSTMALWVLCDWRPALIFSSKSLREMFGFGSRMLSASLIATFFDNLYQTFIGKVFSAADLGLYTRANSMQRLVITTTSNTVGQVMFPSLASVQDDPARLKRGYRKSIMLTTFIHFPLMVGLCVVARPLITLLFSAQWEGSVIFFQLMCLSGLLYPLQVINLDILKVKGRSDLFLNLQVIRRILIIANIVIAYRWGISAILLGQIGLSCIAYLLNSFYSEKLIAYPMKTQVLDVLPALLFSGLMGGGMLLAGLALGSTSDILRLSVQTGVGVSIYLALNWLRKSESLFEIAGIVGGWVGRKSIGEIISADKKNLIAPGAPLAENPRLRTNLAYEEHDATVS